MSTNSTSPPTVTVTETQQTTILITNSGKSSTDTAPTLTQTSSAASTVTSIATQTRIEMATSTQSQTVTTTDTSISTASTTVSSSDQSSSGTFTSSSSDTTSSSSSDPVSSLASTSVSSSTTSTAATSQSQTSSTLTSSSTESTSSSTSSSASSSSSTSSIATSTTPTTASATTVSTASGETSTVTQAASLSLTSALNQDTATSLTTLTTSIDGHLTTITSAVPPTSLSTDSDSHQNLGHVALIAGTTIGAVVLVSIVLGVLFFYKRHQHRRIGFIEALVRGRREHKGAGSIGLLDAEFDDDDNIPISRYEDNPRAMTSASPAPSLFRPRASDSGSAFRENIDSGVKFVDPFVESVGSKVNLSTIVDDVMGPPSPTHASASIPPSGSHMSVDSDNSLYQDPFRDTSHSASSSSVYYNPSSSSPPQSLLGLPAGAALPKRPSPLVNTITPVGIPPDSSHSQESSIQSQASKNWIERSPKKATGSLHS